MLQVITLEWNMRLEKRLHHRVECDSFGTNSFIARKVPFPIDGHIYKYMYDLLNHTWREELNGTMEVPLT